MASKELNVKVKHRYDSASNWTTNNPVLLAGELGIESDTGKIKCGDGTSSWSVLEYIFKDKMDKVNPTGSGSFSLNRAPNSIIGTYSVSEGYSTTASGRASHAEGMSTTASGYGSHAEGNSKATSDFAHAEGASTTASGMYAHSEGSSIGLVVGESAGIASGRASHAEGGATIASGNFSHSQGVSTTANSRSQHTMGEYNVLDTNTDVTARGEFIEIVGNGTADNARSNARTLDWEGNEYLAGNLQAKGLTDGTTTKSMSEILAGGGVTLRRWTD